MLADGRGPARPSLARRSAPLQPVQRLAYLFVMLDITVLVLSGLVLWKSVQFSVLRELLGGYEMARHIHFYAMALLVAFVVVHLAMVALVPRSLLAMIRGK